MEQVTLHRRFDFGVNAMDYKGPLRSQRVSIFECPSDGSHRGSDLAATNYYGNSGSGVQRYGWNGAFCAGSNPARDIYWLPLGAITDGLSQTALIVELAAGDRSNHVRRCAWQIENIGTPEEFDGFADQCRQAPEFAPAFTLSRGRPWIEISICTMLYNHILPPNAPSCMSGAAQEYNIVTSSSFHGSVVNLARADASVAIVNDNIETTTWRRLGSRDGHP